jgi:hypothetical protein
LDRRRGQGLTMTQDWGREKVRDLALSLGVSDTAALNMPKLRFFVGKAQSNLDVAR